MINNQKRFAYMVPDAEQIEVRIEETICSPRTGDMEKYKESDLDWDD